MSRIMVPNRTLVIPTPVRIAGRYRIDVRRPDRVDTYSFHNLITNSGLDSIGNSALANQPYVPSAAAGNFALCGVGTGNTAPAFTDVGLTAPLAYQNLTAASGTLTSTHGGNIGTFTFAQGAVVGNIAEVGVGAENTTHNGFTQMFSHALILDSNHNPTTIPVTSIDQLTVTYECDVYWPTADTVVHITDSNTGVQYTVTCRAAETTSGNWWGNTGINAFSGSNNLWYTTYAYTGALGPITGDPTLPVSDPGFINYSQGAYVSGSYSRTDTVVATPTQWNDALTCFEWTNALGAFQFGFTPTITKNNTQTLTLKRLISWARGT